MKTRETAVGPDDGAKADAIHRALLTGLIANVGHKTEKLDYQGPRGTRFHVFPGSVLFKAKPQWVMSAELVETTRLYARTVAPIQPQWIQRLVPHLLSFAYGEPAWQRETARAMISEKVSLQGLVIIPRRTVPFGKVDPRGARNLFVHHALVENDWRTSAPFARHNQQLIDDVKRLEAKTRRRDLLADPATLFGFFDRIVPPDITDGPRFEKWRRSAEQGKPRLLFMDRSDVVAPAAKDALSGISADRYPDEYRPAGTALRLPLSYRYDPGHDADGITADVPLEALNQLHSAMFERLVPGWLEEKIEWLIRSLPKALRVKFVPVPDHAGPAAKVVGQGARPLLEDLARHLRLDPADFDERDMPAHLLMRFRVHDNAGKTLATGRNLAELRQQLGVKARSTFADLPPSEFNRDNLTRWDFDDLPDRVEVTTSGMRLAGYPTLVDKGDSVALKLVDTPEAAKAISRKGLRRLFTIQLAKEIDYLQRTIPRISEMSLLYKPYGSTADLKREIISAASDRALEIDPGDVRTREEFIDHARGGWTKLSAAVSDISKTALECLQLRQEIETMLARPIPPLLSASVRDVHDQVIRLMPKDFLTRTPIPWLPHLPRFLLGVKRRLDKLFNAGAQRDINNLAVIAPLWRQYIERLDAHQKIGLSDPELSVYRWMMEELRVSLFAQELKTSMPISAQRLEKQWEKVKPARG